MLVPAALAYRCAILEGRIGVPLLLECIDDLGVSHDVQPTIANERAHYKPVSMTRAGRAFANAPKKLAISCHEQVGRSAAVRPSFVNS